MEQAVKKKKKKGGSVNLLIAILLIFGWYLLTFPKSTDLLNRIYNINSISSYQSDIENYSDEDIEQMLQNCRDYNKTIAEAEKTVPFHYQGSTATDDTYANLPSYGTIGSLYIPKLDLNVAIAHGTSDATLQGEAGHLYGSSLPVDGDSVHAIIAAHSALATAELFTHLNELEKDDVFYITVLNQKYEYKVDQITVCLPEDEWQYEQVEDDKNYVTLYTCTPYGVNTHRLLVRGELVGTETVDIGSGFTNAILWPIIKYSILLALIILTPFFVELGLRIVDKNRKVRKQHAEIQKNDD